MRSIILYGNRDAASAVFMQVDAVLRERKVRHIALVQTTDLDESTAAALRSTGGELWYCGSSICRPAYMEQPVMADRYLLASTWVSLAQKAFTEADAYLAKVTAP